MKVRKIAVFLLTGMIMASASPSVLQAEETPVVASGSEAEQASISLTDGRRNYSSECYI